MLIDLPTDVSNQNSSHDGSFSDAINPAKKQC